MSSFADTLKQIMDQLNEVAALKKRNEDHSVSLEVFRDMCLILEHIPPQLQAAYFELLPALVKAEFKHTSNARYSEDYVKSSAPAKRKFIAEAKNTLVPNTPFLSNN